MSATTVPELYPRHAKRSCLLYEVTQERDCT